MLPSTSSKPGAAGPCHFYASPSRQVICFPPIAKTTPTGLVSLRFHKKRVPRRTSTCVFWHPKTSYKCWCHFHFIAWHKLFGSEKQIWNTCLKPWVWNIPPHVAPWSTTSVSTRVGEPSLARLPFWKPPLGGLEHPQPQPADTSDGWKKRSEMDRKSREPMENIISANCDLRTHMLHAYGSIGLCLLAQVWNQVSNLPTITSHAVELRLKSSKWIIGGWCRSHEHECYAFVWFEWGSQIEEVVILRSVQHQSGSNFSNIAKILTAFFSNNKTNQACDGSTACQQLHTWQVNPSQHSPRSKKIASCMLQLKLLELFGWHLSGFGFQNSTKHTSF